jgi:hypothetical protein
VTTALARRLAAIEEQIGPRGDPCCKERRRNTVQVHGPEELPTPCRVCGWIPERLVFDVGVGVSSQAGYAPDDIGWAEVLARMAAAERREPWPERQARLERERVELLREIAAGRYGTAGVAAAEAELLARGEVGGPGCT